MSLALSRRSTLGAILLVVAFAVGAAAAPATWVEQGPSLLVNGKTQGLPDNPVAGAINGIAASPTDPDLLYVASVNGGIWKTSNATAANPIWTPLTDQLPALSFRSIAISPARPAMIFAGTGSTSSLAFYGSPGIGVARSLDGGRTWSVLASSTFAGQIIENVVPTALASGNVVLAATGFGVYRSTNAGVSFVRMSGSAASGLPEGGVTSLVAHPRNASRFYAAVSWAGVYRSDDGGLTWQPASAGLAGGDESPRILLAVHASTVNEVLYAAVIAPDYTLGAVFRSTDRGGTWTAMGLSPPAVFPGGQAFLHGAIVAHPLDPGVVFVSGDRQDFQNFDEAADTLPPNDNGCTDFVGNTFRGDVSVPAAAVWTSVDCHGANGTAPHADSRAIVFDASGNMLQATDGGIFRLVDPNNTSGSRRWQSVNGNVRTIEVHSVAYDPLSKVIAGGTQDNGTMLQTTPGSLAWNTVKDGDGGNVAIDADQTVHPGTTLRYISYDHLASFHRTTWDAGNQKLDDTRVGLNIVSGVNAGSKLTDADPDVQFYQPFVLNALDPARMLIATSTIYESFDRGDSLDALVTIDGVAGFESTVPIAYGGRLKGAPKPDVFYVGANTGIWHRVDRGGPVARLDRYPGSGVRSIAMDPADYRSVFVLDDQSRVWVSPDAGATWRALTGNLPRLTTQLWRIVLISATGAGRSTLVVSGLGGVWQLNNPWVWTPLGSLPHGLVFDLQYSAADDVLVAGILGRGAWTLTGAFPNRRR